MRSKREGDVPITGARQLRHEKPLSFPRNCWFRRLNLCNHSSTRICSMGQLRSEPPTSRNSAWKWLVQWRLLRLWWRLKESISASKQRLPTRNGQEYPLSAWLLRSIYQLLNISCAQIMPTCVLSAGGSPLTGKSSPLLIQCMRV